MCTIMLHVDADAQDQTIYRPYHENISAKRGQKLTSVKSCAISYKFSQPWDTELGFKNHHTVSDNTGLIQS